MQIVIDIPESIYDCAKELGSLSVRQVIEVENAIKNGIPLPKGHGKLIDALRVEQHLNQKIMKYGIFPQYRQGLEMALKDVINIAPTIIEADKESD